MKHGVVKSDNNCFLLEENVGAVPVKVDSGENPLIWLETPEIEHGNTFEREICTEVLGLESDDLLDIEPQLLSAGNPTLFVALRGTDAVDRAKLDLQGSSILRRDRSEPFCVFVFTAAPNGAYARMFAPEYGISEDPATGSSAGPLAVYMLKHNLLSESASTSFICEQGVKMGRRSTLHIRVSGDVIEVGGSVVAVGRGELLKQHPVDQHP
ncbi:MAG: PhzF family phenazine biosynthesis protein [Gammaproteobacteria bacterium]|nr:MAG: PhzF family phenazine biosynthesis protein [Gammaproteobacteria bacterium]